MTLSSRLGQGDQSKAKSFPDIAKYTEDLPDHASSESVNQDDLKSQVLETLIQSLGQQLYSGQVEQSVLEQHVYEAITKVMTMSEVSLTSYARAELVQKIVDEILGLGPLQTLLRDASITEVMVNRFDRIYVEKRGKLLSTDLKFSSEEHLRRTIERIVGQVGRRIDEASPMVDARLADGSRVNAVVPPISLDGSSLTIRKFAQEPFTARDLIATGTITPEAMDLISQIVKGKFNIVISGGTGSGKTTTLNVLSSFIGKDERIVTIEDAAELQLPQPHVVRMESRPTNTEGMGQITIRDLVRNALRMRPDRIVIGEVRDAAALDMLQAMNTGHEGSLTTVHANNARDALTRIETMVLMAGMDLPIEFIRQQIVEAVDVIIQQNRMKDGSRRITQITEVAGLEGNVVQLQDIYSFTYESDPNSKQVGVLNPTGTLFNEGQLRRNASRERNR